jgi:hypothetical protein
MLATSMVFKAELQSPAVEKQLKGLSLVDHLKKW